MSIGSKIQRGLRYKQKYGYTKTQVHQLANSLGYPGGTLKFKEIAAELQKALGWEKMSWRQTLAQYFSSPVPIPSHIKPFVKKDRTERPYLKAVEKAGFRATKDFLMTYEWRSLRMKALTKYGARCMCCGATPSDGVRMHVDHIKPRLLFPELALSLENLQILCEECNHGKGNWDMTDWRSESQKATSE